MNSLVCVTDINREGTRVDALRIGQTYPFYRSSECSCGTWYDVGIRQDDSNHVGLVGLALSCHYCEKVIDTCQSNEVVYWLRDFHFVPEENKAKEPAK